MNSDCDFDGILLGFVRSISEDVKDDDAETCTKTIVEACVTSIRCFPFTLQWYSPTGEVDVHKLAECIQRMPQHAGLQFLGWLAHRDGMQAGRLSMRDSALCAQLVSRRTEIFDAVARVCGMPPQFDAATWPLLFMQVVVGREDSGSIIHTDSSISELRPAAPAAPGSDGAGPGPPFRLVRRPLHIQNISKLGGLHLYKHFKPSSVLPMDPQHQRAVTESARSLTDFVERQYQGGLNATQEVVDALLTDLNNLNSLQEFLIQVEQSFGAATSENEHPN